MKRFFKLLVIAICTMAVAIASAVIFAACSTSETVKIGVLVADASGDEALAFKAYYEDYIAEQYDVEFIYSAALSDEAEAKSQAETFIGQNCKAIIDMADLGRTTIAQLCEDNKVYYAIASGMLSDSDYETVKSNTYFVGQIGPSMSTEYEAGYNMGVYYKNKGVTKVGIYGAFIPNGMHLYRFAGLLTGLGLTYNGKSGEDIVTEIGNSVNSSLIAGSIEVLYMVSWSDTTYTELNTIISSDIDAYLSVGMATTFFASVLSNAGIPFSDIDSFTTTNGDSMNTGSLEYLAGKYSSSIGPIFAAIMSAIEGNPIRDENGYAISISQDYWVATSYEEFQLYQSADSVSDPIFNKEVLDTLIGADYTTFKAAVELDRTPSAS